MTTNKLWIQVGGAFVMAVAASIVQGGMTESNWLNTLVFGVAGGISVYFADNSEKSPYIKAILSVVMSAIMTYQSLSSFGISGSELAQIIVAAASNAILLTVPNAKIVV